MEYTSGTPVARQWHTTLPNLELTPPEFTKFPMLRYRSPGLDERIAHQRLDAHPVGIMVAAGYAGTAWVPPLHL